MAPGLGPAMRYSQPRCQADPGRVGAPGEGKHAGGAVGVFPAPCARGGPGSELADVCGWEVVGIG